MTKLVLLADTHGHYVDVPDGDILIFAGDVTMRGNRKELAAFSTWANALPHKHKIVIAGNHDFCFKKYPTESVEMIFPMRYLEDCGLTLEGISFWGTPWTPTFGNWAFMRDDEELAEIFDKIPQVDVLISHGPPDGILDVSSIGNVNCGSKALWRVPVPKLHVFGHIHEGYGYYNFGDCEYFNASIVDFQYGPINKPFEVEW